MWLHQHGNPVAAAPAVRERDESQLADLRWRDFTRLMLQAMKGRGFDPVIEDGMSPDGIPSDGGDILLERDGEYVLLSCKYGSGSVVGVQAILGLGKSATLRGAGNVIVATPGRFETEAMRVARQQGAQRLLIGGHMHQATPHDLVPDVLERRVVGGRQSAHSDGFRHAVQAISGGHGPRPRAVPD